MPDSDRLAYLRAVVSHRCPELTDADLALMAAEPDGALPLEVAEQILTVIDALQDRWEALAESLRQKPPAKTVIGACRQAMIDLDVDAKADVVNQLHGWIELERSTHESLN
jgi:hypothetical protein